MMTVDEALRHERDRLPFELEMVSIDAMETLAAEVRRLREENERLRNDAERYRWLRESVKKSGGIIKAQSYFWNYGGSRKRLDAAIDAARGAK